MNIMRIALFGYGKMGRMVEVMAKREGYAVVQKELADVCIDFSHADGVLDHLAQAISLKKPMVIGTTGWEKDLKRAKTLVQKSDTAALYSPNFSLGMALFHQMLEKIVPIMRAFPQYEGAGIECHHSQKKDMPSGTAKKIEEQFALPFTSLRVGQVPGTHTIIYDSAVDTITLSHAARSREGFAEGALRAAQWIIGKRGWFTFDEMVRSLYSAHYSL